jgi:hypothetical protein
VTLGNNGVWRFNDSDREEWVNNDELLYRWWRLTPMSLSYFVKTHRREIDEHIREALG